VNKKSWVQTPTKAVDDVRKSTLPHLNKFLAHSNKNPFHRVSCRNSDYKLA